MATLKILFVLGAAYITFIIAKNFNQKLFILASTKWK